MIKSLALLMLFSLPAMAGDYISVDGEQIEVPDGFKVVMVPEDAPENCIAIEVVPLLPIEHKPDPCDSDELVVSGTLCRP